MIFLTVGTHEPFDRLVRAVDAWCAARGRADVFGQIAEPGPGGYRPQHFEAVAALSPADYAARFRAAPLVVSHAGMGSIITALSLGRPLLMLPRTAALRETRNDHQIATAERFKARPGLHVAMDEAALPAQLDALLGADAAAPASVSPYAEPALLDAVRGFLQGT